MSVGEPGRRRLARWLDDVGASLVRAWTVCCLVVAAAVVAYGLWQIATGRQ